MKKETIDKRQHEIFTAAMKVFSQKGFDKATMDEIALELKISKPALYLYFKNKETLFFSMIEDKLKNFGGLQTDLILKMKISSLEKIKKVIELYVKFQYEHLDFFKIMHNANFQILNVNHSQLIKKFMNMVKKYETKISNLMQQAMEDGYLKKTDPEFLSYSVLGIIKNNCFGCILNHNFQDIKKLPEKVFTLFMQGAGNEKHKK